MIPPRHLAHTCIDCEHPVSAVSPAAMVQAMEDHAAYINGQVNRAVDPHFQLHRMDALLTDEPWYRIKAAE